MSETRESRGEKTGPRRCGRATRQNEEKSRDLAVPTGSSVAGEEIGIERLFGLIDLQARIRLLVGVQHREVAQRRVAPVQMLGDSTRQINAWRVLP
jgi:hypothetical protein